jgi:phosphoglycerol transferase MdoB-like AlkP superfamily enzyme
MPGLWLILLTLLSLNIKFAVCSATVGFSLSFFALSSNFIFLGFFCSLLILGEGWVLFWAAMILNFIVSLFAFGDLEFFNYFNHFIPACSHRHIKELFDSIGSLKKLFNLLYLFYFVDLPALFFIFYRPLRRSPRNISVSSPRVLALAIIWAAAITLFTLQYQHLKTLPIAQRNDSDIVENNGILSYHVLDFINYLRAQSGLGQTVSDQDLKTIGNFLDEKREQYRSRRDELFGSARGLNVIIVLLESFENFNLNTVINGREITPNFNKLLKESIYFNNFFTQIGPGSTSDSEFAFNTSLYPLISSVVYSDYIKNDFYSLPRILKKSGYHTYVFHGNHGQFWNRGRMYQAQGIERFFSGEDFSIDEVIGMGLSDKSFFRQSLEKTKQFVQQPFYGFYITLSTHYPFKFPASLDPHLDWGKKFTSTALGDYFSIIHYEDEAVAEFLEGLRNLNLLDNSLIVFYGDHHIYLRYSAKKLTEDLGLPYHLMAKAKVPLIIRLPHGKFAREITYPCGQVDVLPTLLYLLGVDNPEIFIGTNALLQQPDFVALSRFFQPDGSFISAQHLYLNTRRKLVNGECYTLPDFKLIDGKECLPEYQKVEETLQISDEIIRGNITADKLKATAFPSF